MLETTNVIVLIGTVLIGIFVLKWIQEKINGRRYPPSLPALPLVGSLPFLGSLEKLPETLMKTGEKLGPIFSFYSGRKLAVVLNGKEAIVEALVKNSTDFADVHASWTERNYFNVNLRGIAFTPFNEAYRKYHKISLLILKEFGFATKHSAETQILGDVEWLLNEIRKKNGEPLNPKEMLTRTTSGMIMGILFGRKFLESRTEHKGILENAVKFFNNFDPAFDVAPLIRFIPFYRRKLTALAEAHESLKNIMAEAVRKSLTDEDGDNFVKRFVEIEGPGYDREDLFYILRDFSLGSTVTVSTTTRWALIHLANYPAVQERLQKEIDSVVPKERLPSLDDKPHLPYTEAVMTEVMRIKTVLPLSLPHSVSKDKELNGYFIPKGTMIITNLYSVHMDPKVWKDPENFRPERFLDKDNEVIGTDMIMTFGAGKRSCIGEDLGRKTFFLVLTSILQQFYIRPPEGQDSIVVSEECQFAVGPSPFNVRLIPRWC